MGMLWLMVSETGIFQSGSQGPAEKKGMLTDLAAGFRLDGFDREVGVRVFDADVRLSFGHGKRSFTFMASQLKSYPPISLLTVDNSDLNSTMSFTQKSHLLRRSGSLNA